MNSDGEIYDKFVNKNVILTNWNGIEQSVKIIKNDKKNKYLEIIDINNSSDIHYLTYKNIGEGCAVTKIKKIENLKT